ncbi:MAG TPA: type II toxin-antitoxin system VapC family toxin [Rhodanobacteraceae bacterium]|nr:type II toxin-antitoxin system VapC family toxin [Rhodanobacteraceae bacterium]
MIAIDTNVLVRLLIVDDSAQCDLARSLVEGQRVLILRTVLLETEWVLRSRFGLERNLIHQFFEGLAETSGIEIEAETATRRAINAYAKGIDFADALHATASTLPFHTFDEKLLRQRRRVAEADIVGVPKRRAAR